MLFLYEQSPTKEMVACWLFVSKKSKILYMGVGACI